MNLITLDEKLLNDCMKTYEKKISSAKDKEGKTLYDLIKERDNSGALISNRSAAAGESLKTFLSIYTVLRHSILKDKTFGTGNGGDANCFANIYSAYVAAKETSCILDKHDDEKNNTLPEISLNDIDFEKNEILFADHILSGFCNLIRKTRGENEVFSVARSFYQKLTSVSEEIGKRERFESMLSVMSQKPIKIRSNGGSSTVHQGFTLESEASFNEIKIPREYMIGNKKEVDEIIKWSEQMFLYDPKMQANFEKETISGVTGICGVSGCGKSLLLKYLRQHCEEYSKTSNKKFNYIEIDSTFKGKYQGQSVNQLKQLLSKAKDRSSISLVIVDDADMVFEGRSDSDHFLETELTRQMMHALPSKEEYAGNVMFLFVGNELGRMDYALVNRFHNIRELKGPQNPEEYHSLFANHFKKLKKSRRPNDEEPNNGDSNAENFIYFTKENTSEDLLPKIISKCMEYCFVGRDINNIAFAINNEIIPNGPSAEAAKAENASEQTKIRRNSYKKVYGGRILEIIEEYKKEREEASHLEQLSRQDEIAKRIYDGEKAKELFERFPNPYGTNLREKYKAVYGK